MIKTLIALRHISDKEFVVEFYHEKAFRDRGTEFVVKTKDMSKNGC